MRNLKNKILKSFFFTGLLFPLILSGWMLPACSAKDWEAYTMPKNSMSPTISKGEGFYVDVRYYKTSPLKRGDVVMFRYPANPKLRMVKRIVGLGGDVVQIKGGKLYIENNVVEETYLSKEASSTNTPGQNYGPVTVPKGMVFLLGDNRAKSLDSRNWGFVPKDFILGKALKIYKSSIAERVGKQIK